MTTKKHNANENQTVLSTEQSLISKSRNPRLVAQATN